MALTPTIQQIYEQLGGRSMNGALTYTGTRKMLYRDEHDGRAENSSVDEATGVINYTTEGVRITYAVYLWRSARPTKSQPQRQGIILDKLEGVYDDMVQNIVETMYDDAIKKYNRGFINI